MKILLEQLDCVADSKVLTEEKREELFEVLVNAGKYVKWGVSIIDNYEIDRINILQATMTAMKNSVLDLFQKNKDVEKDECIALIDGNKIPDAMPIESKYIIKGDGSVFSIAAASILAKVTRDRIMIKLDKQYPQYNLAQHKGYPTFEHRQLLMIHGPSNIHRYSYNPVRDAALKFGIKFKCAYKEEKEKAEKEKNEATTATKSKIIKKKTTPNTKKRITVATTTTKDTKKSSKTKVQKLKKEKIIELAAVRRSSRLCK